MATGSSRYNVIPVIGNHLQMGIGGGADRREESRVVSQDPLILLEWGQKVRRGHTGWSATQEGMRLGLGLGGEAGDEKINSQSADFPGCNDLWAPNE